MSEKIAFGPFLLIAEERLLLRNGQPVDLGARAFDILTNLIAHPNEIVGKDRLMLRVWPDVTVEEGSLRFHIAALRKALGDGEDGARYIATVKGRGYCFVAATSRASDAKGQTGDFATAYPQATLPARPARIVGRSADLQAIESNLTTTRFVTITGVGGVGKTTVAVAVGHDLIDFFSGTVHFVDLSALSDPSLVATTVASMLGVTCEAQDAVKNLIAFLAGNRSCLILDTCEHLVEAVANLTGAIFGGLPQLHIVATSREPLQVEEEYVYRLSPLAYPLEDEMCEPTAARYFPAVQLFIDRATASGAPSNFERADYAIITDICRQLDGVPFAIELAAARVASFGLKKTAALLAERLALSWPSQRNAPARQRSLQATLEWSYDLLSDTERLVLRRLAVFVSHFPIEAVLAVVASPSVEEPVVFNAFDALVAKSMVAMRAGGATKRYRLLDATRAYVLQLGADEDPHLKLSQHHAAYYLRWLRATGAEWPRLTSVLQRSRHVAGLHNVRAALERCFGLNGNAELGVKLVVAAAPVLLSMSLLTECHRWTAKALSTLQEADRGGHIDMHLQAALGVSLMFTCGAREAALEALNASLAIAEKRGEERDRIEVLAPLQMFFIRTGDFTAAFNFARRCCDLANVLDDASSITVSQSLMGISLHLRGDLVAAHHSLQAALAHGLRVGESALIYLGFDDRILASSILARNLWLLGRPDQAVERALLAVEDAHALAHPLTLSIALVWAISVFLWVGDLERAEQHVDRLFAQAELHSFAPYLAVGRGFRGEIAIRGGDAYTGVRLLQAALTDLHAAPYELLTTSLGIALAQGLAKTHRFVEATALVDNLVQSSETNGEGCYLPELLRVRGSLLLAQRSSATERTEVLLTESLGLSRSQGARAWELRAAIDVATLLKNGGQSEEALALLEPVHASFVEGSQTADLKASASLLAALRQNCTLHDPSNRDD